MTRFGNQIVLDENFVRGWFRAFVEWFASERADEAIEVLSDCSNELYLNSILAWHLRHYGRERNIPLFWARSEWEKMDVCFGAATEPFDKWTPGKCGDAGIFEVKMSYWHQDEGTFRDKFDSLRTKLESSRERVPCLYGVIWLLAYTPAASLGQIEKFEAEYNLWDEGEYSWRPLYEDPNIGPGRLVPISLEGSGESTKPFVFVGRKNLTGVWPLSNPPTASLFVSLSRYTPSSKTA